MNGPFSLAGKRAVVTGGSRGIGAAVSRQLAECAAAVCIGERSRRAGADALVAAFGGVDILLHSAAIWPVEEVPVHEMDDARWHWTMRDNVDAIFFIACATVLVVGEGGRIVHVSSTADQRGEAFHGDYTASKGALNSLCEEPSDGVGRAGHHRELRCAGMGGHGDVRRGVR